MSFEFRQLTSEEIHVIQSNTMSWDQTFSIMTRRCSNEFCQYPIQAANRCYFALGIGDVCGLCHDMFEAVNHFTFFQNAHKEWKKKYDDLKHPDKDDK